MHLYTYNNELHGSTICFIVKFQAPGEWNDMCKLIAYMLEGSGAE